MPTKISTYKITPGDTLASISDLLDVDEFELKHYHNNHCANGQFIVSSLPNHLVEIIIPDYLQTNNHKNKATVPQNELEKFETTYDVTYTWLEKIEKEETMNRFSKKIIMQYVLNKNDFKEVLFTTTDVLINKDKDEILQMEDIALIMAEIYKKINIKLSKHGQISAILNVEEIQKNWEVAKENLLLRNGNNPNDKITSYIIEEVNEHLKSEEKIVASLQYDYAFNLLLKGIQLKIAEAKNISMLNNFYYGFFPEPATAVLFEETYVPSSIQTNQLLYEVAGNAKKDESEIDLIANYLSEKLAHPLAIPDEMIADVPESLREKVLEKKNKRAKIFNEAIQFSSIGNIELENAIGTIFALKHSVSCTYLNEYKKEYTLSLKKIENE
jgi:hypothetical protein